MHKHLATVLINHFSVVGPEQETCLEVFPPSMCVCVILESAES